MDPTTIVAGIQLGLKAMEAWNEYMLNLHAKQKAREAAGETLTMADVMAELSAVDAKVNSNKLALEAKKAAFDAS